MTTREPVLSGSRVILRMVAGPALAVVAAAAPGPPGLLGRLRRRGRGRAGPVGRLGLRVGGGHGAEVVEARGHARRERARRVLPPEPRQQALAGPAVGLVVEALVGDEREAAALPQRVVAVAAAREAVGDALVEADRASGSPGPSSRVFASLSERSRASAWVYRSLADVAAAETAGGARGGGDEQRGQATGAGTPARPVRGSKRHESAPRSAAGVVTRPCARHRSCASTSSK